MNNTNLYETDFYQWTQETLRAIQERDVEHLDWGNLAEEVEALGSSEKRGVKSLLRELLTHLLLYQYWQDKRDYQTKGWKREIYGFRLQLKDRLEAKTMYNYFISQIDEIYPQASRGAAFKSEEAELSLPSFPALCPYSVEQLLDLEFFPEPPKPQQDE